MVRLARILSGVLCGVFTIGVIANLIAMTQGNPIGATGFGLAGLAAYYSYRGLHLEAIKDGRTTIDEKSRAGLSITCKTGEMESEESA